MKIQELRQLIREEIKRINDEPTDTFETIDTEAASSNRTIMVGAFEVDKDKFRGLFRKVNAIFKNKENNKNEKYYLFFIIVR